MLLFDFEKIWLLSGGQSKLIVRYIKYIYYRKIGYEYLLGDNFIVHPETVVQNPGCYTHRVLAEYIGVCALRNYANYQQSKDSDLDIVYYPDYIPKEVITTNPLLAITKHKITFEKEK